MSCIFCQCSSLKKIDLSNFTFDNVCDISFMFYGCSSLEAIVFSGSKDVWYAVSRGENWNEETEHYRTIDGHQIRLRILPADVWFRMYYYHYT